LLAEMILLANRNKSKIACNISPVVCTTKIEDLFSDFMYHSKTKIVAVMVTLEQ